MEPKEAIRPRVLVRYVIDRELDQRREHYAAGYIDSYSGADILVDLPYGLHAFRRSDGAWSDGPCLNYVDGKICDIEKVESAIRAGHGGDVAQWERQIPQCAAPVQS